MAAASSPMACVPGAPTVNVPLEPAPRTKRGTKNLKNLVIQPPRIKAPNASEPASPVPSARPRPTHLSLNTCGPKLRHAASMGALPSATFAPPGGMVLARGANGLSHVLRAPIAEETPSPGPAVVPQTATAGFVPRDESEAHMRSPSYPDGPVAIYDDNVFLFSEPNAATASRFDVVINVAREVPNPFDAEPSTAASYVTAFEFPRRLPEYIHIPWDHNSDITPDLPRLCRTIDTAVNAGRRVLIHCQQGASRSASLIIAYGLWRARGQKSVTEAYTSAQERSRWISPNMRLMYCLQDFSAALGRGECDVDAPRSAPSRVTEFGPSI